MAKTKELKKRIGAEEGEESSRQFWREPSRASGSSFQTWNLSNNETLPPVVGGREEGQSARRRELSTHVPRLDDAVLAQLHSKRSIVHATAVELRAVFQRAHVVHCPKTQAARSQQSSK